MTIRINKNSTTALYKQIADTIISGIQSGDLKEGMILPSMNELSDELEISRETVKKAYSYLRKMEYVEASQGKGFYISRPEQRSSKRVLVIFDKLSTYKEIMLNTMVSKIGNNAQITIRLHNQSVELLKYYLDESLDKYDYYVITPHFPLDKDTTRQVIKQLVRVPFRKMIMLDNWIREIPGNYGVAYQDFSNDIYDCFSSIKKEISNFRKLNVITFPSSMYHETISQSILKFCKEQDIQVSFYTKVTKDIVKSHELYLLLSSQLDSFIADLARTAIKKGFVIGSDISIISYNESPINELVLGGLTTVSTNFEQMGKLAAHMILQDNMKKVRCEFKINRRSTF